MAKKEAKINVPEAGADDALFEALGKNKKRKKRRIIITVIVIILVLAAAAVIGVTLLQKKVRNEFAFSSVEVLSYEASAGSISTVVSGSGTLGDVDLTSVTVPAGVEITEVKIKTNAAISEGDVIAAVDMSSVISAMADIQAEIEELDAEISNAEGDEADSVIYAGVSGRVKAIYVQKDAEISDVMYENGALFLLSLDGYMAVDVESDALAAGDTVTVTAADGKEYTGSVESVSAGTATVLITDDGTEYGSSVTVTDGSGAEIGTGELYVHSPLRITGYAGTVNYISVKENAKVYASSALCTLKNTAYSANYNALLRSRSEKEEILLALLNIKRDGALLSPVSGSVYSVDYSENSSGTSEEIAVATLSVDEKMSVTISVDESDILSLALGQEVSVYVKSISDDPFAGTLTEINKTSSSSGKYSAVVELEKVEGMLSGMTASVSVKIEGVDDAILIPIEALHLTSEGAYVYTQYDAQLQEYGGRVDVVTGLENSSYVEIKSGLSVGDTVYYTEQESAFGGFGGMSGFGGGMPGGFGGGSTPDFSGGDMPDFSGGDMPDFGGGSMPDFGGGGMPGGSDGRRQ